MNYKKYNLVLPIAGSANRFREMGYLMPKPMIPCNKKSILEHALTPFNLDEANIIFIVQKQHILNYSIDSFLKKKFSNNISIIELNELTDGALCTCLFSEKYIDKTLPLVVYTPDVTFSPDFNLDSFLKFDASLLTFKANSPDHSYARLDENGLVVETKEKEVISDNAAAGLYFFKDSDLFFEYARTMINNKETVRNEYYICPIYNYYIKDKLHVGAILTDKFYVLGTPTELEFYEKNVLYDSLRVGLCSDHSGYEAKELAIELLKEANIDYIDYGTFSNKDCDYNIYVKESSKQLLKRNVDMIFAFCRTGQGVNICANKVDGIRSCLIYDDYSCEYAIKHNCGNFFSFPSKNLTRERFKQYINIITNNKFDGGRHYTRISNV